MSVAMMWQYVYTHTYLQRVLNNNVKSYEDKTYDDNDGQIVTPPCFQSPMQLSPRT